MNKKHIIDTLGYGLMYWMIGFILGMIFLIFVPIRYVGWPILAIMFPLMIFLTMVRFEARTKPIYYYFVTGFVWLGVIALLDYLIVMKGFGNMQYYDFDLYLTYALILIIPITYGLIKK